MAAEKKRVAQLGNSHAQVLTQALAGFKNDNVEITSFAPFHDWRLKPEAAGRIVLESPAKGDIALSLDEFDLYVVSAAGWWAARNAHLLKGGPAHPLAFVHCVHWGASSHSLPKYMQLISRAAFEDMVYTYVSSHRVAHLVRRLAVEAGKKVVWVGWPVPSRAVAKDPEWLLNVWYGERMPIVWRDYLDVERRAVRRLTAECGDNVTLLPLPRKEMEQEGFMDEALGGFEPFHGNVKYAAMVVEQLAPLLV